MYATLDDLVNRAGETEILQVADRNGDDAADDAVITAAIEHAQSIIDGYIGGKYLLPLSEVPELVQTWTVSIARYWLHGNGPPDYVVKDYDDALSALKDVAKGTIVLPLASGAVADVSGNSNGFMISDPCTSTAGSILKGW